MNNNAWFKKEKPLLSLQSLGGGAAGTLMSGVATKTYVDDIFDNTVYTGVSGSGVQFTNGIDMAGEKGMVWVKSRSLAKSWYVFDNVSDTAQGANPNNSLYLNTTGVTPINNTAYQVTMNSNGVTSPTTDDSDLGGNGDTYYMPMFRQAKGFFDVVTYTGNNTARTIAHSLGSVPGFIMVKATNRTSDWVCWHRELGNTDGLVLNSNAAKSTPPWNATYWNSTGPTATHFSIGTNADVNHGDSGDEGTYVAYVFAGGESSASTATSVYTDSSGYLGLDESTDFDLGTSDFTIEAWVRPRTGDRSGNTFNILSFGYPFNLYYVADASVAYSGKFSWDGSTSNSTNNQVMGGYTSANSVEQNQWNHVALTRSGSTFKFFLNGTLEHTATSSSAFGTNTVHGCKIGYGTPAGTQYFQGDVSNLRYVLGTALYTDSFKVPTEPLSNVTNTKLLCCQGSATDSATVSPGTITPYNSPSWKAYSPFDDPDGFKFGADEDQNIIKCSSYIGNGLDDGPEINLGWEPQFVLVKRVAGGTADWVLFDSIRGIVSGDQDLFLFPNASTDETEADRFTVTSTGFKLPSSGYRVNASGDTYVYMAIRRPDGYVGKPAEAGTDVFAMDYGNASTTIPAFDSGFPVDFGLQRTPTTATDWAAVTRLMGPKELNTNDTSAEASGSAYVWDSNVGYTAASWADSNMLSWMWKRHSGFDVITTDIPLTAGDPISHNLGVVPEMIIGKPRDSSYAGEAWNVYHKGLNGGTNPEQYRIRLNSTDAEASDSAQSWYDTAPTATHFRIGANFSSDRNPLFLLFASVDTISKVGYYTGTGSAGNAQTTGFLPRLLIVRRVDTSANWYLFDSVRGLHTTSQYELYLDTSDTGNPRNFFTTSSTGFAFVDDNQNASGAQYVYYAHA